MSRGLHVVEFSWPGARSRVQMIEKGHPDLRSDLNGLLTGKATGAKMRLAPGVHQQQKDPINSYLSRPDLGPLVFRGAEGHRITLEFLE